MTGLRWVLIPAVAWLLWVALLFVVQRRMIFPRHLLDPVPSGRALPSGVEEVALDTPSGPGVAWWLAPVGPTGGRRSAGEAPSAEGTPSVAEPPVADGPAAPAVIFAHGNAELAREWAGAFRSLSALGVGVLLVEYPGYGGAPGEPTLRSIADAMVAAYDSLAARPGIDPRRIVGVGRSLGGGAVTELARRRPLAGLVLQSTFTRVADFSRRFLVPGVLMRDRFDNLGLVREFERPVLVLHGRTDEIIPWEHGRLLADAAPRSEMISWECGHNDCPPDWAAYVATVAAFVREAPPVEAAEGDAARGAGGR